MLFVAGCGPAMDANNFRRVDNANSANSNLAAQPTNDDAELAKQIEEIAKEANGRVGVYAEMIDGEGSVSLNADERFAMQSVVKVPIAMAVLNQGKHKLADKITVSKDELVPDRMHSPYRDKNPNGGEITVGELIELAVSVSDGTAADVLQRVAGGAAGVQSFIDSLNIDAMKVKYTHKEFSNNNERQYENWASPRATVALLSCLVVPESPSRDEKQLVYYPPPGCFFASNAEAVGNSSAKRFELSPERQLLLRQSMVFTETGKNRLKALLPKGTVVAHKTGTSGTANGVTTATNDVGLIQLPNGKYFSIAVFVADSPADEKTREAVIAKIAKAIFDKWSA